MAAAVCVRAQRSAVGAGLGMLLLLFLLNMVFATLELPAWVRALNPFHYYDTSRLVKDRTIAPGAAVYWASGTVLLNTIGLWVFRRKERR